MNTHFMQEHYDEIAELLDCLKVGVWITDGSGKTIFANQESVRTGGLSREGIIGKTMDELVNAGYLDESISIKVLQSGKVEGLVQELGDGGTVYSTGVPLYHDGHIEYVITTEREITELLVLQKILDEAKAANQKYQKEIELLKGERLDPEADIIARDPISRGIVEQIRKVAAHDTTVLLLGESGTGKEVYANLLYRQSGRAGSPFIKVNCAAIPENLLETEMFGYEKGAFSGADKSGRIGYFELADKGTLFLDEIGDLPLHLQSKLLRFLQEKEVMRVGGSKPVLVDVKIIASTNRNLERAVSEGAFREDLYYRLNVMPIEIPPLRERKGDIEPLALFFTEMFGKRFHVKKNLTPSAISVLKEYHWPGNIRELKNLLERCVISFAGDKINHFQIESLIYPKAGKRPAEMVRMENISLTCILEEYEKGIISAYLKKYGTASRAADALGMSKPTLCRRMKEYGLK